MLKGHTLKVTIPKEVFVISSTFSLSNRRRVIIQGFHFVMRKRFYCLRVFGKKKESRENFGLGRNVDLGRKNSSNNGQMKKKDLFFYFHPSFLAL